jgi:hypothetical protein
LSQDNKRLEKLLENLNTNIDILTKVTALSFRKDSLFKPETTKQEQVEQLEDLGLPDSVIALIIGSTVESVQALRSQRKSKAKKAQRAESEKKDKTTEEAPK